MPNVCLNESECCIKCAHLSVEERVAALEHFKPFEPARQDRPSQLCSYYCGQFEAAEECVACLSRPLIAARAQEIREATRMGQPYERRGWLCHGL